MKIFDIPWYDRPGERLRKYGAGVLTDAELLAIVLGKARNEGVLELCNKLLSKYNLNKIYDIGFERLKEECNDDKIAAMKILSLIQLCKRYDSLSKGAYNDKEIKSAQDVYNLLSGRIKDYEEEHLYVICLDTKNHVNKVQRIGFGILNASLAHPREVFKAAIQENSNSIILAHNHPSGADLEITETLKKAGELLGIKVLDHVIISKDKYWSWREES